MFELIPKKAYDLDMDDKEHGVLSLALGVSGDFGSEDWTKTALQGRIGEALLEYSGQTGRMDVYNKMGEDIEMSGPEFMDILIRFNSFVNNLPEERSKIHIFDF